METSVYVIAGILSKQGLKFKCIAFWKSRARGWWETEPQPWNDSQVSSFMTIKSPRSTVRTSEAISEMNQTCGRDFLTAQRGWCSRVCTKLYGSVAKPTQIQKPSQLLRAKTRSDLTLIFNPLRLTREISFKMNQTVWWEKVEVPWSSGVASRKPHQKRQMTGYSNVTFFWCTELGL